MKKYLYNVNVFLIPIQKESWYFKIFRIGLGPNSKNYAMQINEVVYSKRI